MHQPLAEVVRMQGNLFIRAPYHPRLVTEIRGIPGRRWKPGLQAWSVPVASEQQVREIVRRFYQIDGEPCYLRYKIVRVHVTSFCDRRVGGGVTIDERDLFNTQSGYLDMRPNNIFEILDYVGGFVEKDNTSFRVDYTLKLNVREDAEWRVTGYVPYIASYEILSGDNPVDQFLEDLLSREEK